MSSDPGDRDDESAALRARLDRLKGELKGRAAPPPRPASRGRAQAGRGARAPAMSLGLRAGSEFVSAVIVGLGIGWVLDRGLEHQSCVSDCIFPDRRRGGDMERDPADFAKTVSIKPQFALVSRKLAG